MFGRGERFAKLELLALQAGLGRLERLVALGERVALLQTDRGLWWHEDDQAPRELATDGSLRLELRAGRDRLHVGGVAWDVPFGAGGRVKAAVARGRLAAGAPKRCPVPDPAPFIQRASPEEQEWLARHLEPGETVLAWLETADEHPFEGAVLPRCDAPLRYLLTDRRAALAAVSEVGDRWSVELPAHALAVTELLGRDTVLSGEHRWRTTLGNAGAYKRIAAVQARSGPRRLVAAAAVHAEHRRGLPRAEELLDLARKAGSAGRGPLARLWLRLRDRPDAGATLAASPGGKAASIALLAEDRGAEALANWAEAWDVPAQHRLALAEGLRGDVAPRDLVPLHRAAWHALREEGSEGDQAVRDLGWARLLLAAGQPDEALRLARARLARLGPGSLDDLLAPGDGDGGDLERAHGTRVQLIELSVQASGAPDPAALLELARLRPLEPERLGALTDLGPDLAARVATALDLLDSHPAATTWADARLRPLPVALRRERLRHPATREGEALGRVQAWIAREADGPDYGALREYAQHIDRRSAPEVVSAIQDASLVLGWDTLVEGYVRHGQQTTGLRACDGPPPFLVVGADHLDPRSELFLGPGELRFLIGSEVAHLALGHARLTSQGLWDRVFDEAPTFLALLADLAPFIPVRGATLARGLQLARLIPLQRMRTPRPGPARDLAVAWGDLLAACRLMQLSADRAGLLICGDLRAATRGLLLASPAGRDALGRAERHGLHAALHRPGEGDELVPTQLALRVAALFSFWLSEDYAVLRDAIRG